MQHFRPSLLDTLAANIPPGGQLTIDRGPIPIVDASGETVGHARWRVIILGPSNENDEAEGLEGFGETLELALRETLLAASDPAGSERIVQVVSDDEPKPSSN